MRYERGGGSLQLSRTSSCKSSSEIIPASYVRSSFSIRPESYNDSRWRRNFVAVSDSAVFRYFHKRSCGGVSALFRSVLSHISFPSCKWLTISRTHLSITPSRGRKISGTLFGHRRGHVSFAVQDDQRSEPVMIIEFPVSTSALMKEMSSGLVRITMECEKTPVIRRSAVSNLIREPAWTMYCNGRKYGVAVARECTESDSDVLRTVHNISVGAGVIPAAEDGEKPSNCDGELLYMRARFERVVGSRDSEAFYMLNPDGNGGPELSIFFLRI